MIARLGRFRAAAERLNKSPAAISVQVQRLEAVAGGRLFERDNRAVVLTPLGQRLLAGTTELLRVHDRLMDELQDTGPAGKVRLGVPDEYAGHVIRDILPVIVARWPRVVLEVETAASGVLTDQFRRGRLDMAVIVRPAGGEHDGRYLVATTPVWVAAPALAKALPDILPLALHAADCPYRDAMLEALTSAGRPWRVLLASPSAGAVETCVEAGLALSVVDRSRVTPAMQIVEMLPQIGVHQAVVLAHSSDGDDAVGAIGSVLAQHFRL
ncbi:LysR family transcriptional regulator [Tistrella mobilis]